MDNFTVTCLRYTVKAKTIIRLGQHAGAQLRGGLYNELLRMAHPTYIMEEDATHLQTCPICRMMNRENPEAARGRNVPRPYGILPPPAPLEIHAGETFSFGVYLYAETALNFQMITLALTRLGQGGVGFGRGRFQIQTIENFNPLTGETVSLLSADQATLPQIHVTAAQVQGFAQTLPDHQLTLRFITPTRLIHQGKLVKQPTPEPLIARLLERLEALETEYAEGQRWGDHFVALTATSHTLTAHPHNLRWTDLHSGSRRLNQTTPIGGFIGDLSLTGDLSPFKAYLVWGTLVQIGKDTVKGNGWYQLMG